MKLLVSVRNATEALAALAGGADVIDAKEPDAGSLGPVGVEALRAIRSVVPREVPLSAALGDLDSPETVARLMRLCVVPLAFVKVGFRGIGDASQALRLLREAVRLAASAPGSPAVVAVGYADHARVESLPFPALAGVVAEARAGGVLVDTALKDRGDLFSLSDTSSLTALGAELERQGRFLALGGSLGQSRLREAARTGAAIFGVRGSACRDGRSGSVDAALVRSLAEGVRNCRVAAAAVSPG